MLFVSLRTKHLPLFFYPCTRIILLGSMYRPMQFEVDSTDDRNLTDLLPEIQRSPLNLYIWLGLERWSSVRIYDLIIHAPLSITPSITCPLRPYEELYKQEVMGIYKSDLCHFVKRELRSPNSLKYLWIHRTRETSIKLILKTPWPYDAPPIRPPST